MSQTTTTVPHKAPRKTKSASQTRARIVEQERRRNPASEGKGASLFMGGVLVAQTSHHTLTY